MCGSRKAVGRERKSQRRLRCQFDHGGCDRALDCVFGLIRGVDDNSTGVVDKHSGASQSEADDGELLRKRFENDHTSGVVEAWEDESNMTLIRGFDLMMRQVRDPIDVGGDTEFFGNLPEPWGILSFTNDLQPGSRNLAENFRHCAQHEMQTFPAKETADEEEAGRGRRRRR